MIYSRFNLDYDLFLKCIIRLLDYQPLPVQRYTARQDRLGLTGQYANLNRHLCNTVHRSLKQNINTGVSSHSVNDFSLFFKCLITQNSGHIILQIAVTYLLHFILCVFETSVNLLSTRVFICLTTEALHWNFFVHCAMTIKVFYSILFYSILFLVLRFKSVGPFPDSCAELACFTVDQLEDERTTGDDATSSGQEVPEWERWRWS